MPDKSLILYCNEPDDKGVYFSHFYGGALVHASDQQRLDELLNQKKAELNIAAEMKWDRVSAPYQDKYIEFIRTSMSERALLLKTPINAGNTPIGIGCSSLTTVCRI